MEACRVCKNPFELFEADFCLTDNIALILANLDVCFVVVDGLFIETESVAKIRLCLVCNLEATDLLLLEALAREEVEDVLYVLDAVDMAVDVHVAIIGVDGAHELRFAESETSMAFDWADVSFFRNNIIEDVAVVEREQVAWLACLKVYHGPNAASIAEWCAISPMNGEVAIGEELHHALYPCPDLTMLILSWHLVHFDAQSRENPGVSSLVQGTNAPATLLRVVTGGVEHVITQHTKEYATCEINVERLNVERIAVY